MTGHQHRGTLIAIHCAVLLFALSGLFAKWITLPALLIVVGRTLFAGVFLFVILVFFSRKRLIIKKAHIRAFVISGSLLGLHWYSFFHAIQLSTVGFGLLAFATFPLFTSIVEPLMLNVPFRRSSAYQALVILAGVVLIFPTDMAASQSVLALVYGLLSAFSFSLLVVCNRQLCVYYKPYTIACYQNLISFVVLCPFVLTQSFTAETSDVFLLVLLGVVFTALAHSLLNYSLQVITAFYASVAISLEPIYGIVAAWLLLGETLNAKGMLGATLILVVSIHASLTQRASS